MDMGPGHMAPIRITFHTLIRYWLVSPWSCAAAAFLLLAAFWYVQATLDLHDRDDWWPPRRTAAFLGGLVAIELALQSSVAVLPYISFPMLAVQHLLLVAVAAPLIALGAPVSLASETSSPRVEAALSAALESRGLRALLHPVTSFVLMFLALFGFSLNLVDDVMTNVWLLDLTNVGLLAAALVFWGPFIARDPLPHWDLSPGWKAVSVLGGGLAASGLGLTILGRSAPVAPIYTLHDSRVGGAILGAMLLVAMAGAAAAVVRQWQGQGEVEGEGQPSPDPVTLNVGGPAERIP